MTPATTDKIISLIQTIAVCAIAYILYRLAKDIIYHSPDELLGFIIMGIGYYTLRTIFRDIWSFLPQSKPHEVKDDA